MLKRIGVIILSIHFLLGSTLLPKGDFALLADLPAMYQQYTCIDDPQDIGLLDFVGDYLLNGEAILGAENYKGHPVPYASVQFQHTANPLSYIFFTINLPVIKIQILHHKYTLQNEALVYPNHYCKLFRPPVAC